MKNAMKKPKYHIFLCNSYRVSGDSQGACNKKDAPGLLQYTAEAVSDRGIDAAVSTTGCLNVCGEKPVMVIYPNAYWYGNISEDAIDAILDALEQNQPAQDYLLCE